MREQLKMKDDELDISYYLKILKRRWAVSVLSFIIVLGAVIAYTLLSTPVYEAKSLVVISGQDQTSFLLGSSAPKVSDLETQRVVMLSQGVMNPVYSRYGVDTFTPTVNIIKDSNILEIVVETDSAENAVLIANGIAISYLNYTKTSRSQDATAVTDFINAQIEYYNEELDLLSKEIAYYERQSSLSSTEKLEYQALQREINAKNKLYDSMLLKKEEAGLVASLGTNVQILSYAELPYAPIRPNIPLNIVLGLILAIGAAFISALTVEKIINP